MKLTQEKINESIEVFDQFMNVAITKLSTSGEVDIVKVMTAYNQLKMALSTVNINNQK